MKLRLALLACSFLLVSPPYAADVYRWVDENGKVHFSDVVPEKYRKSARKMASPQQAPTEEQRKEAEARAAQDKERAGQTENRKADANAKKDVSPPAAPQSQPKPVIDENTDCATLHRLYRESLDCFAPYISAVGTTKAEAFDKCTPVPDPAPKCGPAK